MTKNLNDLMEFDRVIRVTEGGTITEAPGVYAPDVTLDADWDDGEAHVSARHKQDLIKELDRQGWTMVRPRRAFGTYGSPFLERRAYGRSGPAHLA